MTAPARTALEATLFDLDGTLVDSERANIESVAIALRRFDKQLDDDDRRFIVGHAWNEIHERITRKNGLDVPMDQMIAWAVEAKRELVERNGLPVLPGAVALVRRLSAQAPAAVVSGSSRAEVRDAISGLGLMDAFQFLLAAEDYSHGKPNPEPYATAMRRFGARPERCLVIEDATPGILSGRAAGAKVIGVRAGNFSGHDLSPAHVIVDTLEDITDELVASLVG